MNSRLVLVGSNTFFLDIRTCFKDYYPCCIIEDSINIDGECLEEDGDVGAVICSQPVQLAWRKYIEDLGSTMLDDFQTSAYPSFDELNGSRRL